MNLGTLLVEAVLGLLRGLASALYRCARGMRQNLLIQTVAIGTMALMLLLCGTLRLCSRNLGQFSESLLRNVEMIVYLQDGISPLRTQQIAEALGKLPGVLEVHIVNQKEAQERLRRSLGDQGDLLDGVEEGVLPASIEVEFRHGVSDILRVHPIYERLRNLSGVEDVELMGDWVRRVLQAQRLLSLLAWSVGLLVALSCLYIVAATIRLGVYARRDEIEVMKLVGATNMHVEAPFLLEGLFQGLIGTGLAALSLYVLFVLVRPELQAALREVVGDVNLVFLPGREVALAIGLGGLWGLLGSAMAVGKHVRV